MPRPDLFFLAGQSVPRCGHVIDKYFVGYQTLQFMDGGRVALSVGRRRYALAGRHAWSCYAGPRIAFRPAVEGQTWVHRYVAFRGPLVKRWAEDGMFPVSPTAVADAGFGGRFDAMLELAAAADRGATVRAAFALEGLLLELSQTPTAGAATPRTSLSDRARRVLDRTTPGGDRGPDYERVAADLGVSVRGLRRHFREQTGTSPHQYAIARRVATARELLLTTELPVKEIARRLGYADVFYFGRQFKRQTGVSPALLRRSREG